MTGKEILDDLGGRLERARLEVLDLAEQARFDGMHTERARLRGKAEGLALAKDYLRAYGES